MLEDRHNGQCGIVSIQRPAEYKLPLGPACTQREEQE